MQKSQSKDEGAAQQPSVRLKRRKLVRNGPTHEEKQVVDLETKIQALKRLKAYREKGEQEELKDLVSRWRSIAQQAAETLLSYFTEDSQAFLPTRPFWDSDENQQQYNREEDEEDEEEESDYMLRMLKVLQIDHELLQYSPDDCGFYD